MCDYHDLIVVTNRKLCRGDFLAQMEKVCALKPKALILREKDLTEAAYEALAAQVLPICARHGVPCYLHTFADVARRLGCENVHFSLPGLREHAAELGDFRAVSVSCHSVEDVLEAQTLGATQALLGNIYETDCKKGLQGKGLDLLRAACGRSRIPVYAIGGIDLARLREVLAAGAAGGCMMSGFMTL